jgi:hypothetical protein
VQVVQKLFTFLQFERCRFPYLQEVLHRKFPVKLKLYSMRQLIVSGNDSCLISRHRISDVNKVTCYIFENNLERLPVLS